MIPMRTSRTIDKYLRTVSNYRSILQPLMQIIPPENELAIRQALSLWEDLKQLDLDVVNPNVSTIELSNSITSMQKAITSLYKKIKPDEAMPSQFGTATFQEDEPSTVKAAILNKVIEGQQTLLTAYNMALEANSLAAEVQAVRELQNIANRLTVLTAEIGNLRGL